MPCHWPCFSIPEMPCYANALDFPTTHRPSYSLHCPEPVCLILKATWLHTFISTEERILLTLRRLPPCVVYDRHCVFSNVINVLCTNSIAINHCLDLFALLYSSITVRCHPHPKWVLKVVMSSRRRVTVAQGDLRGSRELSWVWALAPWCLKSLSLCVLTWCVIE